MAKRKYLTNQQIFNRVAKHLLEQNEKSFDPETDSCVYRSPDGLMCAAGCLIPPHVLVPENVYFEQLPSAVHEESGVAQQSLDLVGRLQNVHDEWPVNKWRIGLAEVADDFGLKCNF
jgi:hypothetical protein